MLLAHKLCSLPLSKHSSVWPCILLPSPNQNCNENSCCIAVIIGRVTAVSVKAVCVCACVGPERPILAFYCKTQQQQQQKKQKTMDLYLRAADSGLNTIPPKWPCRTDHVCCLYFTTVMYFPLPRLLYSKVLRCIQVMVVTNFQYGISRNNVYL